MCAAMSSACLGEKTRSESEKRTSVGRSQRASAVPHPQHRRRGGVIGLGRDELGERTRAGLRLGAPGTGRRTPRSTSSASRETQATWTRRLAVNASPTWRTSSRKRSHCSDGSAHADPRVEDHEPRDALGVLDGEPQPERPTPVVHDERHLPEVELQREPLEPAVVAVVGVVLGPRSACRSGRSRSGRERRPGRPRPGPGSALR